VTNRPSVAASRCDRGAAALIVAGMPPRSTPLRWPSRSPAGHEDAARRAGRPTLRPLRHPAVLVTGAVVLLAGCAGTDRGTAPLGPQAAGSASARASSSAGQVGPGAPAPGAPSVAASSGGPATASASPSPSPSPSPKLLAQLPLGGRSIFPRYRVVAYYGSTGGSALGVLGKGTPEQAAAAILHAAAPYAAYGRPVQPAMELIAAVAQAHAGADGTYSYRLPDATIASYLAAARRHRMLLLLDVQPGRADFLSQVRQLEPYLTQPDVGIALDPEWKLTPSQLPLRQIGSSDAAPINAVSAYVAGLVQRYRLPEKLFVVHQFQVRMLPDRSAIVARPGLAMSDHVDGQGPVKDKLGTYAVLRAAPRFHMGFKLFYVKDPVLMTPKQVMALDPRPELITYQ